MGIIFSFHQWTIALTQYLEGVGDGDGLLHEEDLAGVVSGVLRPDPGDLQVVPRHQLEPGIVTSH